MEAQLKFVVDNQTLARSDSWRLVATNSENYLKAKFDFISDPWVPSKTTGVFLNSVSGLVKTADLDENGECFVPNEVLTDPGELIVSLYCSDSVTRISDAVVPTRVTSNPVYINIYPSLTVLHSGGES